jgi:hypothetical protein
MFIYFLYMFRATMCPSLGEIIVSLRHFVFATLCRWLWYVGYPTQNDKHEVSHRYSYFSWWWAHSCPKHVEKRNKHTKKNCAPSWLYKQDFYDLAAYRVESLHPPGHTVTAVRLSDTIKGRIIDTDCNKVSNYTPACWFAFNGLYLTIPQ